MSAFLDRLRSGPPLVLDGGFGSMLIARGLPRGTPPDRWNLDRPGDVAAVHRAYVEAGSDAVHTNTFGANRIRLERFGLADRCLEINEAAVRIAREARPSFVIGDVGPTGEYLPPVGHADPAAWPECFEAQGQALSAAGVDAMHVETASDLREALAALAALRRAAPATPIMVSMTFERKKRGFFTIMGNSLIDSLRTLAEAGAAAVGANCSIASPDMRALAEEAVRALNVPLVIQPNAGQPEVSGETVRYAQTPESFAGDVAAIAALGVRAVGGCCGTDPRFIAALRSRLNQAQDTKQA
ncbi:MAG: homocysteine S-methyltransferase family protein [Acidobacteriota bacterium]